MFIPYILKFHRYRSRTNCEFKDENLGDEFDNTTSELKTVKGSSSSGTVEDESSDLNQKENSSQCNPNSSLKVYLMSSKLMSNLVQMETSRGSLASGRVPVDRDLNWLFENVLMPTRRKWRILAIDTSYSTSNIGILIFSKLIRAVNHQKNYFPYRLDDTMLFCLWSSRHSYIL
jgi:hypothetical protein